VPSSARSCDFNIITTEERPHEALDGVPPATVYQPSRRSYPSRLPEAQYDESMQVRRVRSNGQIKWQGKLIFVSEALIGEPVGIRELDEFRWQLRFCSLPLGIINMKLNTIERLG
jgi:putative transposase